MPSPHIAPVSTTLPSSAAGAATASKALFWNRIAARYAAAPIADMGGYETTLRRVQGLLSTTHDVLEIGCGTGSTALRLAPFTRRLLATDVSSEMIAIARQRLAGQPSPQLSFAVADAEATAFGQRAYDVVLAFNLPHRARALDVALTQVAQALRPGGLLISKTPCIAEMNPLIAYLAVPLLRASGIVPRVLCLNQQRLQSAMVQQGMQIVCAERHGTRGKDFRAFMVARKPG
ncbi:MAG: methyltransferase domain-containing protein [Proteobacteria bacterium]|nr:methyltransferase domain-containing protein [Pseudomonadota bacterium]